MIYSYVEQDTDLDSTQYDLCYFMSDESLTKQVFSSKRENSQWWWMIDKSRPGNFWKLVQESEAIDYLSTNG